MPNFFKKNTVTQPAFSSESVLTYLQQDLSAEERANYLEQLKQVPEGAKLFTEATHIAWVTLIRYQTNKIKEHQEIIKQYATSKVDDLEGDTGPFLYFFNLVNMMINGERNGVYEHLRHDAVSDFGEPTMSMLCKNADELLQTKTLLLKNTEWVEQSLTLWKELISNSQTSTSCI